MKTSVERRSFLKQCAVGGAGLLANSYGFAHHLRAQMASDTWKSHFRPAKTLCGCFNIPSLAIGKVIGAQATRLIFQASDLDREVARVRSGASSPRFQLVRDLADAGILVIATYHWIRKQERKLPEPGSTEWQAWLKSARGFVEVIAPHIVGITLDNEPITSYVPSEFLPNAHGVVPAIEWFKALAAMIRETAPHLLISTPALNTLESMQSHPDSAVINAVRTFFDWARTDSNIDAVDVHAHVESVKALEAELAYAAGRFPRGIIMTEWSQAGACRPWDPLKIDVGFAAKWKRSQSLTNQEYIAHCESHPVAGPGDSRVSLAEWNAFVATAPIDPDFMIDAFAVIKKHHVLLAAYGAAIQYGKPLFDIKQLYANLTVVPGPNGEPQPNYRFPEWFKAMVATA